jgi:hypothetical protein
VGFSSNSFSTAAEDASVGVNVAGAAPRVTRPESSDKINANARNKPAETSVII